MSEVIERNIESGEDIKSVEVQPISSPKPKTKKKKGKAASRKTIEHLNRARLLYSDKKVGPRSEAETDAIYEMMAKGHTTEEIAKTLGRNEETIVKWIEELHLESIGANSLDVKRIIGNLHKSHFWQEVCKQFTTDELKYFEGEWVTLMLQFKEDVLAAEILSLRQLVTINILINRCMKERKAHLEEIEKLQKDLDKEYKMGDLRDPDRISSLEQQISYARSAATQYTVEYTKLLDQQKTINKDMKATRDQRIKRIEDSKTSFAGLIRALEEEDYRKRMGGEAELMKIAKNKAKRELGEYHEFADNKVDRPLLNADTVLLDDEQEDEGEENG